MPSITVNVSLYGDIAKYAGGNHVAQAKIVLDGNKNIGDLLEKLTISTEEKGYIFKNAVLCDAPGLDAAREESLCDGDHVGIFSIQHMWPYQYRDGVHMSDALAQALDERGAMHNIY
jgi:hypothetical protein